MKHASFSGLIGIARADITPPVGIYARNWGAAQHETAESVHRPLWLSALTISANTDTAPLVLIDADLGWWRPLEVFLEFRDRLLEELRLDASRFIFALTHTHSAAPLMRPAIELPGSALLAPWLEGVYQATLTTIRQALATAFAATLDWHFGRCQLARVRDLPDPDPTQTRFICGFNPQLTADDTLWLGRISNMRGEVRATIVNYACHPTTLAWENRAISPDYLGTMRTTMEAATGAMPFFLQGMSGDLAPREQYVGDGAVPDRHGRQLAHAALATLNDMEPPATELVYEKTVESGAPLAIWKHRSRELSGGLRTIETTIDLELKDWPPAAELERLRQASSDRALQERLRRQRDIRQSLGDGKTYPHPINAWRVGDAILIGSCSEAYSQLQRELRQRFPDRTIICMNLINGSIGYLPPSELYSMDVYPVWQTPFARGGFERLRDAMVEVIEELLKS